MNVRLGVGLAAAALAVAVTGSLAAATLAGPTAADDTQEVRSARFDEAPVTVRGSSGRPADYDGTFEFVRVRYDAGRSFSAFRPQAQWAHDYDRADREILAVLNEVTNMEPRLDGYRVLRMDDPDIFAFPAIYLVEIGFWNPGEEEIAALGAYLEKGGFLIVDDFRGGQLRNLLWIMNRVAPGLEVLEVPDDHPIFDSFFRIDAPRELPTHPVYGSMQPVYLGLFEDNDPYGRLMAIFNYDNDIAEWWETFSYGFYPIDLSNEAFKFGVNYVVYAHTH